jgi:AraC-like DNA-binding protein
MTILEQSWSTKHLQPGKALSYWRDVICENLLQMHIHSSQESAFFGHIEKHAFGPIKANFISVSEQRVWRDRTAACSAKDHLFHLIHVRKGVQLIEQYGRSLKVEAGDCLLIDCLAGFEFDFPQAAAHHDPSPTTHKRALLRRVTATIRERCHEPDLDPAAVAAALGLSRRYVHMLFASAGTTFSQELYACRLHRAQRLLCDRRFEGLGIAEIAWNCGFSEPSHFTRRFRERFGSPPSAYRLNTAN